MNGDASCERGSQRECVHKTTPRTLGLRGGDSLRNPEAPLTSLGASCGRCSAGFNSFKQGHRWGVNAEKFFFKLHELILLKIIIIVVMFKKNKSSYILEKYPEILTDKLIQCLEFFSLKSPEGHD